MACAWAVIIPLLTQSNGNLTVIQLADEKAEALCIGS